VTATQEDARPVAAALAVVLAEVLGLDLPDPTYITVSPGCTVVEQIGIQFTTLPEADARAALEAWAAHFGTAVHTRPAPTDENPREVFSDVKFTVSGVAFHAYGYFTGP